MSQLDLFNNSRDHIYEYENQYGDKYTEVHKCQSLGSLWLSNIRSDMYVPCVTCYQLSNQGKETISTIGGRVSLYVLWGELTQDYNDREHICKGCLSTFDVSYIEQAYKWYVTVYRNK